LAQYGAIGAMVNNNMTKPVYKKTHATLLNDVQSLFDALAWLARHELGGDTSIACRALLANMNRFIELLERDQRRELS